MLDSHTPIFDESLINLDVNREALLYWCRFYYHRVFSLSKKDRPTDFVIDYDILLDDWLKRKDFAEQSNTLSNNRKKTSDMQYYIEL